MTNVALTVMTVFLAALANLARATTISTPVIAHEQKIDGTWWGAECLVLNASTSPIDVNVTLFNENGSVIGTQDVTIQPDNIESVYFIDGSARTFCRIEGSFSKKLVKASLKPTGADTQVTTP